MKANQIDLRNVKLQSSGIEANYVIDGKDRKDRCRELIHPDLREAVNKLIPYLVDICEMEESDDINWNNLDDPKTVAALTKYTVSGMSLSGSDNSLSLVIIGHKLLESVKTLHLNSPRVNISEDFTDIDSTRAYELRNVCQQIAFEVEAYILNHKYAATQGELDFNADNDDPFEEGQ